MRHILTHTRHSTSCAPSAGITPIRLHRSYLSQDAPYVQAPGTAYIVSNFLPVYQSLRVRVDADGCDCKLLNPLTDINGIRGLSRLGRPTRSSRAPHRHDSDARAFTRALYRGGRNHVGPANVLSCASRLQDPSPRHARRNRADFRPKISSKYPLRDDAVYDKISILTVNIDIL